MKRVAILGAGITGLSVAWYLKKKYRNALEIAIYEKSGRAGGWIESFTKEGFRFEGGPRGFRPKGQGEATLELISELGLTKELVPSNRKAQVRYIAHKGKLRVFSPFYLLQQGVVRSLWCDLKTPASSLEDESIAQFAQRRFKRGIAEGVIDPLVHGIFAGDPKQLSIRSCFPKIWQAEQRYGSVLKGF